jgi:putative phosphoribosyl transferase
MLMQDWFSDGVPIQVPAGTSILDAELQVPPGASGLIILTQAGNRPRYAQRVQNLAESFLKEGFGILIMDLLTEEESEIGRDAGEADCFEEEMLDERLDEALTWLGDQPETLGLSLGLLGIGPGSRAIFPAAAAHPGEIAALVAAGLDIPPDVRALRALKTPALLVAGEQEGPEADAARAAFGTIPARKRIEVIPGCALGREDTRTAEKLSRLACHWFSQHML